MMVYSIFYSPPQFPMRLLTAILIFFLAYGHSVFAWNGVGHRVVAQIAYDYMSQDVRKILKKENKALNSQRKTYNLVDASTWLDHLYKEQDKRFKPMHYIDIPYSVDGHPLPKIARINAVSAILQSKRMLENPDASATEKAIALRIILHVVGDIHQPLHAVTQVSTRYPQGDRGGNLVRLHQTSVARNLHEYWDKGGGWLHEKRHYHQADIKRMATNIEKQWACQLSQANLNPKQWAAESHQLSIEYAYKLPENGVPNRAYEATVKRITTRQIALAGCRLAALCEQMVTFPTT